MRKDKQIATEMRKKGKSYRQIHQELRIPMSTLSDWFNKEEWSSKIRVHLAAISQEKSTARIVALDKIRGEHLARAYEAARVEARKEFEILKYDPLFISGIMLYWGEGAKDPKQALKLTNSDPKMISFYVQFLLKSCRMPMEKIKAYILIYPQIEEKTAKAYWSKVSKIPWENFTKTVVIEGRHATRRLGWGVCTISVSSTYFKQKFLEWMELLPQELLRKEYYENISR